MKFTATVPAVRSDGPAFAETGIAMTAGAKLVSRADAITAYSVLRLGFGFAIFMHGLARFLGGINSYALPTIASFHKVPLLPHALVVLAVYAIPCVEIALGALILLGLFTRIGLLGTFALLIVLLFGTSMQQSWVTLAFQLIYVLMVSILLLGAGLNSLSLDALLEHSKRAARVR